MSCPQFDEIIRTFQTFFPAMETEGIETTPDPEGHDTYVCKFRWESDPDDVFKNESVTCTLWYCPETDILITQPEVAGVLSIHPYYYVLRDTRFEAKTAWGDYAYEHDIEDLRPTFIGLEDGGKKHLYRDLQADLLYMPTYRFDRSKSRFKKANSDDDGSVDELPNPVTYVSPV